MEYQVDFRDKKLSLLEAKVLVMRLKTGITNPNLTEKELADYTKNVEDMKKDNERCKKRNGGSGIWKENFSKADYLIQRLNWKIGLIERDKKHKYCEEHGHKEKVNAYGNAGAYCRCKRCGASYTRHMDSKEYSYFDKVMRTPFNI
jgi:hypothetical protein